MALSLRDILSSELPPGTLSGRHPEVGLGLVPDLLVIEEFGSNGRLSSNQELLDYVLADERLLALNAVVSHCMAKDAVNKGIKVVRTFQGKSAKDLEENLGTFGEQLQLKEFMDSNGYERPAYVTNGHNIGNIVRQAGKVGITDIVVPPKLPHGFDWRSLQYGQPWTSCWPAWAVVAKLRMAKLLDQGH